jgi:hypothetical protein
VELKMSTASSYYGSVHSYSSPAEDTRAEQREAAERRAAPRCACKGSISIRQSETRFPLGAAVSDISLRGCYVELLTTLPVGTAVDLVLRVAEITVNCAAEVRTSHPGVGMGMEFVQMSETDRGALERAIAPLSSSAPQ